MVIFILGSSNFYFQLKALFFRFYLKIDCFCLGLFMYPSILTKALVLAEEKQLHSMMLPSPCFTMGIVILSCFVFVSCISFKMMRKRLYLGLISP